MARSRCRDLAEGLGTEAADGLAADAMALDEPGGAQTLEVVADQRLAEAHVRDELADRGVALGEAPDDAQPVHVREGLVERTQVAQVIGLDDDRRDGRADVGGGRHGWVGTPGGAGRRINGG